MKLKVDKSIRFWKREKDLFQYISNKMQLYTVYLYLETALYLAGDTSTHHQECIQLYLSLPLAIGEEVEQLLNNSGR
jgi:hypothetical protein